jgi:hypothetical protein
MSVRRTWGMATVLVLAATGLPVAVAGAASAQDSVTGEALLPGPLLVQADATSGPAGESPSGRIALVVACCTRNPDVGGSVTCLNVSGNRAIIGLSHADIDAFTGRPILVVRLIEVIDGGSPGVGVDVVTTTPLHFDAPPITSCPATLPAGGESSTVRPPLAPGEPAGPFFPDRPLGQDLVVVDAQPVPTSKEQCRHGGYARFGFRNQGQCIAFVERGARPGRTAPPEA